MLTEDVGFVLLSIAPMETSNFGSNAAANLVVSKCIVTLVQLRVRLRRGIHTRLIVAEDHGGSINWNSKVSESGSEVDDLFCRCTRCDIFGSESGGLDRCLEF